LSTAAAGHDLTPPDWPRRVLSFLRSASPFVWVIALVLIPNVFLLFNSLWASDGGTITHTWTFDNYSEQAQSQVVQTLLGRTLLIAVITAAIATAVAYPSAYFVVRTFRRHKLTLALLVLVPLWIGLLMRVFAWKIILGRDGVLSGALESLGLTNGPTEILLNTKWGVILALSYVAIPFVFIIAYTTLERIPDSLFEASADSGASPWRTFWTVAWPLSRSAAAIGFAMAFILAFSDYVTPQLVGGFEGTMLGSIVIQEVGLSADFPAAATIAMLILVVSATVLTLVAWVGRTEARFE
jgi:spermidine/putrescine transport system permease protein